MVDKREVWIDNLKGVGIVLVVLGHMAIPQVIGKFIFSFHMPLFFFLSGYLFKGCVSTQYFRSKFDHLVVPYLVYAIPLVVLAVVSGFPVVYCVRNTLLGNGLYTNWFLTSLFCTSIFGALIVFYCWSWRGQLVAVLIVVTLGFLVPYFQHQHFLSCHTWCPATAFWLIGHICSRTKVVERLKTTMTKRSVAILGLFLVSMLFVFNIRTSIAEVKIGNPILFYPSATATIVFCVLICRAVDDRLPLLQYLGRNSLVIMIWHVVIPAAFAILYKANGLDPRSTVFWKMASSLLNLAVLMGVVVIINRYCPLLSGRMRILTRKVDGCR